MHSIAWTQKIPTFMSSMGECQQQKHTQHTPSMKTKCDYVWGWIRKCSHTQKSDLKWRTPEISWERRRRGRNPCISSLSLFYILHRLLHCLHPFPFSKISTLLSPSRETKKEESHVSMPGWCMQIWTTHNQNTSLNQKFLVSLMSSRTIFIH